MAFEILISNNASTTDTIREIITLINQQSKQPFVMQLARALRPDGSKAEYIHRLFDLICYNVKYEMDPPGWEKLYTPAKLFIEAKGDCKKMTIAIASVLKAAGIEPLLKVISYNGNTWEHIYVLAKIGSTYYILDPVNNERFNSEIQHAKGEVFNLLGNSVQTMGTKLSVMGKPGSVWSFVQPLERSVNDLAGDLDQVSEVVGRSVGLGCKCGTWKGPGTATTDYNPSMGSIGLKNNYFEYTGKQGVQHVAAVPTMAVMRAAFLGLLYLGKLLALVPGIKFHLTHRMAIRWNQDPNHVRKWWWLHGGEADASAVRTALIKVVGGSIAGPSDMKLFYGEGYDYPLSIDPFTVFPGQTPRTIIRKGISGIGEPLTLATAAAAVLAATPLIIAAKNLLKEAGIFKEGDTDPPPTDSSTILEPPPPPPGGGGPVMPKPPKKPIFHPIKHDKDDNTMLYVGGAALALLLLNK